MSSIEDTKQGLSTTRATAGKREKWKKYFPTIAVIVVLAAALVILYPKLFSKVDNPMPADSKSTEASTAKEEDATSSQGKLSAALVDKKVTVLCFRSDTCQPCIEMDTIIEEIKPEFEDKVSFISVVVDDPEERPLIEKYEIQMIPTTFIIDKKGQAKKQVGVIPKDQLTGILEELVNK